MSSGVLDSENTPPLELTIFVAPRANPQVFLMGGGSPVLCVDILFLDHDGRIRGIEAGWPEPDAKSLGDLKRYTVAGPMTPAEFEARKGKLGKTKYILVMKVGEVMRLGLRKGELLEFRKDNGISSFLVFLGSETAYVLAKSSNLLP